MKRIIFSFAVITVTVGALLGGTTAFFSDVETSTANTFTAGALDLKVDNESYYNGNKCAEATPGVWLWQGEATYPVPGTPCTTSWDLTDLDEGHLFFDFTDVKPDDEGEDTISLHVQNDAYACMDMTLTKNDDTSSTEPELKVGDAEENVLNDWDGELAQAIEMLWWADDGDNVHEVGEAVISGGVKTVMDLASTTGAFSVALADATHNVWGTPGPIPAEETAYIAKAWCFGTLAPAPLPDDADTGPLVRGTGVTCDGTTLGNVTQTDTATLDIVFRTEQARHNGRFLCNEEVDVEPENGTITVVKIIEGNAVADDFSFSVNGGTSTSFEVDGTNIISVPPGSYDVVEDPAEGFVASYENDVNEATNCDDLVVTSGGNVTCTITNTFVPVTGTLTIHKVVSTGPLSGQEEAFSFAVDGGSATAFESDGTNVLVLGPGDYDVLETTTGDYVPSYANSENGSANCTDLTVVAGQDESCTITNTYSPTTLTIEKIVSGGTAVPGDFTFTIDSNAAVVGANAVVAGAHTVAEINVPDNYSASYAGGCDENGGITAVQNQNVTCSITNTFTPPTPTTITITKSVVGGTGIAGDFTFRIDGNQVSLNTPHVVTAGAHTVTETDGPANYVATFGGDCNASGTITAVSNTNVTCAITNTFVPPATTTIVTEDFGTGDCLQDIPGWDEDPGESCTNGTVAAAIGTGDDTASPDGGRFALIGNNGYICRTINATGLQNLQVSYYWRGDTQADAGENGLVTFATGGTCAAPTGTTTLAAHPLTTLTWQSNSVPLPASLNNTVFFARFFSGTNAGSESFRVDGLSYTGVSI